MAVLVAQHCEDISSPGVLLESVMKGLLSANFCPFVSNLFALWSLGFPIILHVLKCPCNILPHTLLLLECSELGGFSDVTVRLKVPSSGLWSVRDLSAWRVISACLEYPIF